MEYFFFPQELLRSRQRCIQIESELEQFHQSHWALLDEYGRLQDDFRALLRSFKTGSTSQAQVKKPFCVFTQFTRVNVADCIEWSIALSLQKYNQEKKGM